MQSARWFCRWLSPPPPDRQHYCHAAAADPDLGGESCCCCLVGSWEVEGEAALLQAAFAFPRQSTSSGCAASWILLITMETRSTAHRADFRDFDAAFLLIILRLQFHIQHPLAPLMLYSSAA